MVRETFEWILESLNVSTIKVLVESDVFDKFFDYLYVNHYRLPYLDVVYLYEFVGSDCSHGDYLAVYNIYIVLTTGYLPEIKDCDLTQEEKQILLDFVKSRISKE